MPKEEAAEILDPETSRNALWKYEGEEQRLEACNEACRIAAAALRAQQTPLDRSRWEGCRLCKGAKSIYGCDITAFCGTNEDGTANIYTDCEQDEMDFDYCPNCGRPLTEEAWAEMERRINGGTTNRTI